MTESLNHLFERHLLGGRFFVSGEPVIVAVSTGVDSMTLLDLLEKLPANKQPIIIVAHVNHELRAQSDIEEKFLYQYCQNHHLELHVTHWPVSDHPRHGIEEAGRHFRYQFFARLMQQTGARVVMTAHHGDDQAETVLMKLVRGDALTSLRGIYAKRPFAQGTLVRPLLPFTKEELRSYATSQHLQWFDDATNDSLSVSRNRYRHRYLPALATENRQVKKHLDRFATDLGDLLDLSNDYCRQLAAELTTGRDETLALQKWQSLPAYSQRVFLRWWLQQAGVTELKRREFQQINVLLKNAAHPQARVSLPGKLVLIKNYQQAYIQKNGQNKNNLVQLPQNVVELGAWYPLGQDQELAVLKTVPGKQNESDVEIHRMWLAPDQLPLTLRRVADGDHLLLRGGHLQRVSRVMIDAHVPKWRRRRQSVLVDAHGVVVWLVGLKLSWFERIANYQNVWHELFLCRRSTKGEPHE